MGGYGATRIGMKHPDVFGSVYIMSPCCLAPRSAGPSNPANDRALEAVKTPADSAALPFGVRAQLASAAAWSPNPKNPPLYLDLPAKDGVVDPAVIAKWAANAPLALIDQYIGSLRRYRAIAIDVGPPGLRVSNEVDPGELLENCVEALDVEVVGLVLEVHQYGNMMFGGDGSDRLYARRIAIDLKLLLADSQRAHL